MDLDALRQLATLARLDLDDEELERQGRDLDAVLDHMAKLAGLDLEGVEPLTHATGVTTRLDEDEVRPSLDASVVRDLAPETEGDLIRVPKVIG